MRRVIPVGNGVSSVHPDPRTGHSRRALRLGDSARDGALDAGDGTRDGAADPPVASQNLRQNMTLAPRMLGSPPESRTSLGPMDKSPKRSPHLMTSLSASAQANSPPSWARVGRENLRSCTSWPDLTRQPQARSGSEKLRPLFCRMPHSSLSKARIGFVFRSFAHVSTLDVSSDIRLLL